MTKSMTRLTHVDPDGRAAMVDIGAKKATRRQAEARGRVRFNERAFQQLRQNRLAKGDALAVARLAGIQAAKRTADWIPLCHTIPLDHLEVQIELDDAERTAQVTARARARWPTGVEMEALVAVSAACLALYDMAKAIDRGITIEDVQLVRKSGGRSGAWKRRIAPVLLTVAALAFATVARADLQSRSYQFKDATILEMAVTTAEGLRLESVHFQLPAALDGPTTRTAGLAGCEVAVTNGSTESRRVGLAIALFDDDGHLLGVASGGSALASLRPGRQKKYVLTFDNVNTELRRATTFQISIESRP